MSQPLIFQNVSLREFWLHEAWDFTPWLGENLSLLSQSLNLELAFEAREQRVDDSGQIWCAGTWRITPAW